MKPELRISNLHVEIDGREIVKGLDLHVRGGEIHVIMGPNGAGKSTLASALMGKPGYTISAGSVRLNDQEITAAKVDERARLGLFLAMQYPSEIEGVSNANFIRVAANSVRPEGEKLSVQAFRKVLRESMALLDMDAKFADRYLNEGFSGGEKKRNEILQMLLLKPKIAILDEIDSGLDIDALRIVSKGVNSLRGEGLGVLIITHYQRILKYIKPDFVHVLMDGKIVRSGDEQLVETLEEKGYEWIRTELGLDIVPKA